MTNAPTGAPTTPDELGRIAARIASGTIGMPDPNAAELRGSLGYGIRLHLAHVHLLAALNVLGIDDPPIPARQPPAPTPELDPGAVLDAVPASTWTVHACWPDYDKTTVAARILDPDERRRIVAAVLDATATAAAADDGLELDSRWDQIRAKVLRKYDGCDPDEVRDVEGLDPDDYDGDTCIDGCCDVDDDDNIRHTTPIPAELRAQAQAEAQRLRDERPDWWHDAILNAR